MSTNSNSYQKLEPLTISQRIYISLAALRFFSPMDYEEHCKKLEKTRDPKVIRPFSGLDFVKFIKLAGELPINLLPEPDRHLQRIGELLRNLVRAGLLTDLGAGSVPLLGNNYYALYQPTSIEKSGALILARALGPSFLHWAYQAGTYQITGVTKNGDQHAGIFPKTSSSRLPSRSSTSLGLIDGSNKPRKFVIFDWTLGIDAMPHSGAKEPCSYH